MATLEGETLNWADGRGADTWRRPRRSQDKSQCWECRLNPRGGAHVRDSQHPSGAELGFPFAEWVSLMATVPGTASPGDR